MFFRKSHKRRFDQGGSLRPQVGHVSIDLGPEWLEGRQLLTATTLSGAPSCADPENFEVPSGLGEFTLSNRIAALATTSLTNVNTTAGGTSQIAGTSVQTGSLSGYVFTETSAGSPAFDPVNTPTGETPLAGVVVALYDANFHFVADEETGLDGSYSFGNLPAGTYSIVQTSFPGTEDIAILAAGQTGIATYDAIYQTPLAAGANVTGDDLPNIVAPASLAGYVFSESHAGEGVSNSGSLNSDETGLQNVSLSLIDDATGNSIGTVTSNSNGQFTFPYLAPGSYQITATTPDDYSADTPLLGTLGGDLTNVSGQIKNISVTAAAGGVGYDFPEVPDFTDLAITKSDDLGGSSSGITGTAVPGQQITYSITVTNFGPRDVTGAAIVDTLPSSLGNATFLATQTGGASGFSSSGTGGIDDEDVDLPSGSTVTYTVTATIASSATGTLSNTATVMSPTGVTDSNTDNNTATDSDTLVPEADLEITKTDNVGGSSVTGSVGTAVPGSPITYTITVRNNGPSDADGSSIEDVLPDTLSGATYTATGTGNVLGFTASGSGNIDDEEVDLPSGSAVTYTVTATISSSATGTLSNTATVTPPVGVVNTNDDGDDEDDDSEDDVRADIDDAASSATDSDTLTPEADLEITKTDNLGGSSVSGAVGTAVPGLGITYTITVTNGGPSDVTGASIIDELPGVLTGATYTAAETGNASGFTASGTGGIDDEEVNLPSGSSITYTLSAAIPSSATGTLSNTATVTPPVGVVNTNDGGDDSEDDVRPDGVDGASSATDTDTLTPEADLEITKTDNVGGSSVSGAVGTAVPGSGITYTITVTNDGPSDVTGASIIDDLPGVLTGATYTATETGNASGFAASGTGGIDDEAVNLPTGSTVTYTVTATIASSATGTLSNTATVTPPIGVVNTNDGGDDNSDDEIRVAVAGGASSSATDTDTLTPQADLAITKTDNLGGSSVNGSIGTAIPGQTITYTITVTNAGPSNAPGVQIVDDLPSTLASATYTATATGGASGFTSSGTGSIDDDAVSLPTGSTVTYVVTAAIPSSAAGTLSNTATLTPPEGVTEPDPDNDSATDDDSLSPQPNVQVTKTDNLGGSSVTGAVGTAVPGQNITYTITVTNTGPSDAAGTQIVDDLPAVLTGVNYTASATGDVLGFTASGTGDIDDDNVDLTAGSTVTYIVTGTIPPSATGSLSNTATVSVPHGSPSSNLLPATTIITVTDDDTLTPEADLTITKTDNVGGSSVNGSVGTVIPGQAITYTITVTNAGPSDAPGAEIIDDLPSTLVGAAYTATGTGGASGFTTSGTGDIDDDDVDLPTGSTVTYIVTATIPSSATGTLSNTAMVTPPEGVTDPDLDNDSATDNDNLSPQSNLGITKTDNLGGSSVTGAVGTAVPGQNITYTITVTNTGPSGATGAEIVDDLPSALSGATFTATETGDASGFTAGGSGNIDDSDVALPAGSTITYIVTAAIAPSATGTLSNTATVSQPVELEPEMVLADESSLALPAAVEASPSATDSDTLTPQAELEITKTDNLGGSSVTGAVGTAIPGEKITYTITVSNTGPSDANGAQIVDTMSDLLSGVTYTAIETGDATGFTGSGTGNIDDANVDLPVGSSITYAVVGTIASSATGELSNTAKVTSPVGVTNTNAAAGSINSFANDDDLLTPQTNLEITKTDNLGGSSVTGAFGTAIPGEKITYTITVSNTGPSDANGAEIIDDLPGVLSGATYTAIEVGNATGFTGSGTGSIDDDDVNLPAGSSIAYTIVATIASSATGTLSNTATIFPGATNDVEVFSDQTLPAATTAGNISATDSDNLTPQADLEVTKTDNRGGSSTAGTIGTATAGQTITYTITVTNDGPSDVSGASVIDTLSSLLNGATYRATATGGATGFSASGSGSIDDTAVNLPVGSSITYTITATISSTAKGSLSNTVTVAPPDGVTDTADGGSTATDQDILSALPAATPQVTDLGAIDFTVSALLTKNLTVTGSYLPPPGPQYGLPISQPYTTFTPLQIAPPFMGLPAPAVDQLLMGVGPAGGDVEFLGQQFDLDLTKMPQAQDPLWNRLTNAKTEDWSSDELIGSLLDKLADVDELSLVSFEFGDDVVTPATRKSQPTTTAKPVLLEESTTPVPPNSSSSLDAPAVTLPVGDSQPAGDSTSGTETGAGGGDSPATAAPTGVATGPAPPEVLPEGESRGWSWWAGVGASASSLGALGWIYTRRRRGRGGRSLETPGT